jgi:hypothetical protein
METISTQFYNLDQSWHYEIIVRVGGVKLRVLIRRNAYDDQSYVRGYAFSELKWNLLVDRPIQTAKCEPVSYVQSKDQFDPNLFVLDGESVLKELQEIVS